MIGKISINLLSNIIQCFIVVISIPFATNILDPEDYGVFGAVAVFIGLVTALCENGSSFVLNANYPKLDKDNQSRLLSTLIFLSLFLGVLSAFIVFQAWSLLVTSVSVLENLFLTDVEVILICLTIPLRILWSIINPVLIIKGVSYWLAISLLIQSMVNVLVILCCLYILELNRISLFWGQFFSLLICAGLGFIVMGGVSSKIHLHWINEVRKVAFRSWIAGIIENIRGTFESLMIINFGGNTLLGNYNHAKTYQYMLTQTTNAVANVLWPIALNEANNPRSDFSRIRTTWNLVYLGLTCAGLGSVLLGHEVISLLTHEKFTWVSVLLPWLVIYVLLQNAGKPATAVLFALGKGNVYSTIRILSLGLSLLGLWLFVPLYGVLAVVGVLNFEMLFTRFLIGYFARSYRVVPFTDSWVLAGCLLIIAMWWFDNLVRLPLIYRGGIFFFVLLLGILMTLFILFRKKPSSIFIKG